MCPFLMGDDAPFLHIVHQVPSYSPPTHLFSLNYLVWIIYTLDTLKEKKRNLFTWCELKGKVMSTAKCILKIKGVGAIWRKKCSFPCPWNHLWLLTHLHRRQFLFWKLWRHWKPLRMSQPQCWPDSLRITGVFTKSRSLDVPLEILIL